MLLFDLVICCCCCTAVHWHGCLYFSAPLTGQRFESMITIQWCSLPPQRPGTWHDIIGAATVDTLSNQFSSLPISIRAHPLLDHFGRDLIVTRSPFTHRQSRTLVDLSEAFVIIIVTMESLTHDILVKILGEVLAAETTHFSQTVRRLRSVSPKWADAVDDWLLYRTEELQLASSKFT